MPSFESAPSASEWLNMLSYNQMQNKPAQVIRSLELSPVAAISRIGQRSTLALQGFENGVQVEHPILLVYLKCNVRDWILRRTPTRNVVSGRNKEKNNNNEDSSLR